MPADEDLVTSRGLVVPFASLNWTFARSTGAGGQHINKTSSKSTLTITTSEVTGPDLAVERVRSLLPAEIRITSQKSRSQWRNRQLCMTQLRNMLDTAAMPPTPPRRKSRPSRGSIERRLESKRRESQKKESRRTDNWSVVLSGEEVLKELQILVDSLYLPTIWVSEISSVVAWSEI
jgi:ribosome-associated protein